MRIVCLLLTFYWFVLFARIISSWFPAPQSPMGRRLLEVIHDLTEPVLSPLRRLIPPVRMGMAALDLSPIIVFIVLGVITRTLGCRVGF